MKVYKTRSYCREIVEIEATRVSEKSVWIENEITGKEERHGRSSYYGRYFDTKEDAKQHLINVQNNIIEASKSKIERAKIALKEIEDLNKIETR